MDGPVSHDFPPSVVARNGAASVCVLKGDDHAAMNWLGSPADSQPVNWVGLHVQAMILVRTGQLTQATALFRQGLEKGPFEDRRLFKSGLAYAMLRSNQPQQAAAELENEPTLVARVLQIHIYSALNDGPKAFHSYTEANRLNRAPRVIELTAELGARARLEDRAPSHSDEWVFEREFELLLAA